MARCCDICVSWLEERERGEGCPCAHLRQVMSVVMCGEFVGGGVWGGRSDPALGSSSPAPSALESAISEPSSCTKEAAFVSLLLRVVDNPFFSHIAAISIAATGRQ